MTPRRIPAMIAAACLAVVPGCGLRVTNRTPAVAVSADYVFVCAGAPVTFTAVAADPDGTVGRYEWDFGDGTTLVTSLPGASHAYAAAGVYTVEVWAVDNDGGSAGASVAVTVTSSPEPCVLLEGVDIEITVADGPVDQVIVNGETVAVGAEQEVVVPVELSGTTAIVIDATDVAGNPAATYEMTVTKHE
ncbi:MAG: PKD domain-containing protein [Planctomycetes bacterium]|nr:PKD domain-containing protein [Planctomycetota bacterium]